MLKKNWKNLFRKTILDRGYGYYLEGAVEDISREDDVISATVSGTDLYEVEIFLDHDEVYDMDCDCPYAEDGNYCKHMAAVLYELEDTDTTEKSPVKESIADIINAADEATLRSFLVDILENDEKLKQRFLLLTDKPKASLEHYKKLIDSTIYEHQDKWGFIDYEEATDFYEDMEAFNDDIRIMMDNGQYRDAFQLSLYICQEVADIDSDDDGEMTMIMDDYSSFWAEIAEKMTPQDKDWLFEKALLKYELNDNVFLDEYLETLITRQFREERYRGRVIDFIDIAIQTSEPDSYQRSDALRRMADYLNDTETPFEEIETFCREHWDNFKMREWLARQFIQQGEWQKAIVIYEDLIESDLGYPGSVTDYREELL
ncbi:MAG: SWIM zinc finger family protein, partial [Ruminococcus sp.]|nr:SWIM zinc finger family protein [Ruminococcus sp.]